VLGAFALAGGLIHLPLAEVLPAPHAVDEASGFIVHLPLVASLAGIALSWFLFLQAPQIPAALATNPATAWLGALWKHAWGFDWLYDVLFVRPFVWLSRIMRNDPVDGALNLVPATLNGLSVLATATQNGNLRWYAAVAGAGLCLLIGMVAFT
jgi:NADH-quinone oxidoreductase subunit L